MSAATELNYTENGEITYNPASKEYTVWDEIYCYVVCKTPYPKVAEAALKAYCDNYLGGSIDERPAN